MFWNDEGCRPKVGPSPTVLDAFEALNRNKPRVKEVWKYQIKPNATDVGMWPIEIVAPMGAKPLHIAQQHGMICLWCEVDPAAPVVAQIVLTCVGTGWGTVPDDVTHFQSIVDGEYVWHFYNHS